MRLVDLLPEYYKKSAQVVELQAAFELWTDALLAAKTDLFDQMSVLTATWGLTTWERALALETDISKPYPYRRDRIKSKLRGSGTTTTAMIENVARSFSGGDVAIIEVNDEYRFDIKFIGTMGIPPNMNDLTAAIEEIKPAHLSYVYVYIWITWDQFDDYNKTFDAWDALNLTWDEFEAYKEVA